MPFVKRRVVPTDPVETVYTDRVADIVPPVQGRVVETTPARPSVIVDDPIENVYAATQLIQTIVWSVVVLVLLAAALLALHSYAHLF